MPDRKVAPLLLAAAAAIGFAAEPASSCRR